RPSDEGLGSRSPTGHQTWRMRRPQVFEELLRVLLVLDLLMKVSDLERTISPATHTSVQGDSQEWTRSAR
ncbi:MAG: hypothetical protein LUQ71_04585, partial [Methanoregula sp.]|nr:hypothetical protein [Methanoregula sp.]